MRQPYNLSNNKIDKFTIPGNIRVKEVDMTLLYLKARYPGLKGFIQSCHDNNELDKLWDFMLAIETDEIRRDT